jgi:hypothetical protein
MRRLQRTAAVIAIVLLSLACSREKITTPPTGHDGVRQKALQALSGGSAGFICGTTVDGNFFCICDLNNPSPDWSCDGMSRFCDLFDHGDLCDPDGFCSCRFKAPARTP